jgi:4-diphosphocytidyl-2-C-methyl-D-erythritol kinase
MTSGGWPAPAKLNLFLHITGRRPDGYHTLQTAFQIIDLCDSLDFEVDSGGRVDRVSGHPEIAPSQDLAVRAAALLKRETGTGQGARIAVRKRIPLQAGLGGGSSDAATTLLALNELWGTGLATDELALLGLQLGADVPLFVRGRSAWAEGLGEQLVPLDLPARWFALIWPGVAVSTAEIFQAPELTRNSAKTTIRGFLQEGGRNDCEPVATLRYPQVRQAIEWLGQFGQARMTGTGSGVFAAFAGQEEAAAALEGLPPEWRGFLARGLACSPLLERLGSERAARGADLG